jgi:hypothetical protein
VERQRWYVGAYVEVGGSAHGSISPQIVYVLSEICTRYWDARCTVAGVDDQPCV